MKPFVLSNIIGGNVTIMFRIFSQPQLMLDHHSDLTLAALYIMYLSTWKIVWPSLCENKSQKSFPDDCGVLADRQDWARDTVCLHTSMSL